ncbi:MAG: hypothetical protein GY859_04325, partial [Desulfobacterales bacterium]|nr:hypothetical protein [Desulfobacterales bacterium]
MIIWVTPTGIKGWRKDSARAFILRTTKVPSGATRDHDAPLAMLGKVGIAEEQGWWAGKT